MLRMSARAWDWVVLKHWARHLSSRPSPKTAPQMAFFENVLSDMTFVTASAGNHGLSVVAGANAFGAKAVIYLAETVPASFQEKLRSIGADVVVEGVDYEASMSAAEQAAKENGWFLLSDSTWPGYAVGADVMKGYMLSAKEIVEQCPRTADTSIFASGRWRIGRGHGAISARGVWSRFADHCC